MIKKFFVLFICIILTLSFCSCKKKVITITSADIPHTIDSVTYQTSDGVWSEKNVNEMIEKYCAEKATVDITVSITFTTIEPFHDAIAQCDFITTPVESENAEYIKFTSTKNFSSSYSVSPDEANVDAGTYTLTIKANAVCFYSESTKKDNDGKDYKITTCISEIIPRIDFMKVADGTVQVYV